MSSTYEERKREWEELDITRDELDTIKECMKKPEFRKLLSEYAEEINDPENRKLYEEEITQLERERGFDVTFVKTEPGYVLKTSFNDSIKCFINICKSDKVEKPSSEPSTNSDGSHGLKWSIPYTLIPPRDDLDKSKVRCRVFDVAFHPDALYIANKNSGFRKLLNETALDGIEKNFKVKLDRNNLKFPNLKYKGVSQPTVIRTPCEKLFNNGNDIETEIYQKLMTSYDEQREKYLHKTEEPPKRQAPVSKYYKSIDKTSQKINSGYTVPKFIVKQQNTLELEEFRFSKDAKIHSAIPKNLVIEVNLPLLKSATDAILDVQEKHLSIKSETPAKYHLELPLSYRVDPDNGNAKFDSKFKKLIVTLPVIRDSVILFTDSCKEDSGVDSDHGSPDPEKSFEEQSKKEYELQESSKNPLITILSENDEVGITNDEDSLKIEADPVINESFLNPKIKYSCPSFTCNLYDNVLALTIHVKNVDSESINHRILENNSGFHILLTSIGAGFFPIYNSLCLKIEKNAILPESLMIEPWDNNVVVTVNVSNSSVLEHYYSGIDEQFMEMKDFSGATSIKNKLQALTIESQLETEKNIEVIRNNNEVIVNLCASKTEYNAGNGRSESNIREEPKNIIESSGDELSSSQSSYTKEKLKSKRVQYSRSISESSVDENTAPLSSLENNSQGSDGSYKGILKPILRIRSVSESSVDENSRQISSLPNNFNSGDLNSDSEVSASLKKTVRFNTVVSRQLYRSNSSILGQRKKNQRKMRNKKRAHERRLSESENSEAEDHKFKVDSKNTSVSEESNVKPILRHKGGLENQKTANIAIEAPNNQSKVHKRKFNNREKKNSSNVKKANEKESETENSNGFEFKNDLLFELDM